MTKEIQLSEMESELRPVAGDPLLFYVPSLPGGGGGGEVDGEGDDPETEDADEGETGDPPAPTDAKKPEPKKPAPNKANEEARKFRQERNTLRDELKQIRESLATERAERLNAERRAAAVANGLPETFVSRIQGETAEEIKADAKAMADAMPKAAPVDGDKKKPSPANPTKADKLTQEMLRKMTAAQIAKLPVEDVDAAMRGD